METKFAIARLKQQLPKDEHIDMGGKNYFLRQVTTRKSETSLKTYTFVQTVFVCLILGPRQNSGSGPKIKEKNLFESIYMCSNHFGSFYSRSTSEARMSESEAGNRQEIIF